MGVGFDIDHTLLIDNKLERVAFLHLLDEIVERGGRWLGSLAQETAAIDALLAAQRAGEFTIDEAVNRFARERGARQLEGLAHWYRDLALSMVDAFVVAEPGAREVFGRLRAQGLRTAVLTNGWNPLQQAKCSVVGFAGPLLVSSDLGVQKPRAEAFAALADALGAPAADCWYVGDDPRNDVAGARNAGMRTVWLDGEGAAYPSDIAPPDVTIHSLEELVSAVVGAAPAP